MKFFRAVVLAAILALQVVPVFAGLHLHGAASAPIVTGGSELSLATPESNSEYPFLNSFKLSQSWGNAAGGGLLTPDELVNGYPLAGGDWAVNHSGATNLFNVPSQSSRPGHYTLIWWGAGARLVFNDNSGSSTSVSCTGTTFTSAGPGCDNTGCSTFTASIAGTTLTVTAAPTGTGCTLGAGVPITGTGVTISTFDTPTIITSAGSACGGNTCYTVNQSQTVGSVTMTMGGRFETIPTDSGTSNTQLKVQLFPTTGTLAGIASFLNGTTVGGGDETAFWNSAAPLGSGQASIISPILKTRIQQAGFTVLRDLDWSKGNINNCATWATRRGLHHASYAVTELRNAASGTTTYVAGGQTYTVPLAGQYVNAGGTGASGGTISYNSGTDVYSITLGTGSAVDKQTIGVLYPAAGTSSSKISINGNTGIPIKDATGQNASTPGNGSLTYLIYDKDMNAFLSTGGGLNCFVPPEVFIEINAELGTTPWHVMPYWAMDSMTDWVTQYATYVKGVYPSAKPTFEVSNEPFNFGVTNTCWFSAKSTVWITADPTHWIQGAHCGSSGNNYAEIAKMASTSAQDIAAVYGAGNYDVAVPVQTVFVGACCNEALQTTNYVNQTIAVQTGYAKTAAYKLVQRVSINNYWSTGFQGPSVLSGGTGSVRGTETGIAYCYYFYSTSSSCQGTYASQTAVMTAYMASSTTSGGAFPNVNSLSTVLLPQWQTFGLTCSFGVGNRPGDCSLDQTTPLVFYEGGYNESPISANASQSSFAQTNGSADVVQPVVAPVSAGGNTTFAMSPRGNGCIPGQTIALSALTGGTWSSAIGSYVVQSVTPTTCTVNLNSSGLGTFGTASTTATANWSSGATTIAVASCTGVAAAQYVADATSGILLGNVQGCSGTTLTLWNSASNPDSNAANAAGSNGDTLVFSTAVLTYTGSNGWINYLRAASYQAPELDTLVTTLYTAIVNANGKNPSQYQAAINYTAGGNPWFVWSPDWYGYMRMATCSSCTISSTTLTLGGTITGVFRVGDTLLGSTVTGKQTGNANNTVITSCTPVGSNPCGTTSGDTLGLSLASTIGTGQSMTGNATPPLNGAATDITSPVKAWHAICAWNGNGNQC